MGGNTSQARVPGQSGSRAPDPMGGELRGAGMENGGRVWWVGALKRARTSAAGKTSDEVGARKQGAPLAYVACPKT